MTFRSRIARGSVYHKRFGPVEHAFTYPFTFFAFDLEELPRLSEASALFNYNHTGPLSIHDRDFLHRKNLPISNQLNACLPPEGPKERTVLIGSPRYFGYAFNPVNFYLRMQEDKLLTAVVEVNNTFGDTHIYPLTNLRPDTKPHTWVASCAKNFHVSPFNDLNGEYRFTFRIDPESIFLGVDLYKKGQCLMQTYQTGKMSELKTSTIFRYALFYPFDTAFNSLPRITWQAAKLYFSKQLEVYRRPKPDSKNTLVDRDHPESKRPII